MAMTLRLTREQEHTLATLAEAEGISRQEAVIRAINDAAARKLRSEQVRALSERARDRYADVLSRLGE